MSLPQQPVYTAEMPMGTLVKKDMHTIALLVVRTLGWHVTGADANNIHAFTEKSGEVFDIKLGHGSMVFSSKSIDLLHDNEARNRENLEAFKLAMESQLQHLHRHGELRNDPIPLSPLGQEEYAESDRSTNTGWFKLLIPRKGFIITPIIAYLCTGLFLVMTIMGAGFFDPTSQSLIKWGADYSPLTLGGQWWRLITCVFVHVGVFHLVLNLFGLIFVAIFVEPILGAWRFLVAYLVMGVLASLCSLWWHTFILSAGASGAIMGVYGLFMALLSSDLIDKNFRKSGLVYFGMIVGLNLLSGLKDGIDNAAHVGGLLSGFIIGYMYYPSLKMPEKVWLKYASIVLVLLLGGGVTYYATKHIPNYMAMYESKMTQFDQNRDQALKIFELKDTMSKQKMLTQIDSQGIQLWQQNIQLVNELDNIPRLPAEMKTELKELRVYSELREHDFKLQYKRVNEDTNHYDDSLAIIEHKIDSVLKLIYAADSLAKK